MPVYQYQCHACGQLFEVAEPAEEHKETPPECPRCQSDDVEPLPRPMQGSPLPPR